MILTLYFADININHIHAKEGGLYSVLFEGFTKTNLSG